MLLLNTTDKILHTAVPTWLDENHPLPAQVHLVPLRTRTWGGTVPWLVLALFLLSWLVLPILTVVEELWRGGESAAYFTFGALAILAMFTLFLLTILGSSWREFSWLRAKQAGRLRHGLFLGPDLFMVRLRRDFHLVPRTAVEQISLITLPSDKQVEPLVRLLIQGDEEQYQLTLPPEAEITAVELETLLRQWVAGQGSS